MPPFIASFICRPSHENPPEQRSSRTIYFSEMLNVIQMNGSVVNDNFNELNLRRVSSGTIAFPFIRMTHKYFSKYICDIAVIYICSFFQLSSLVRCSSLASVYVHDGHTPGMMAWKSREPIFFLSVPFASVGLASPSPNAIVVESHVLYAHCLRWVWKWQ